MAPTVWFENSHYGKLRSDLMAMCSSQPVIRLRPVFAPFTWASDPFVMFQNGIRFQLIDLFTMLHEMATRIDTIEVAQCVAVRKWITGIGHMVVLYFHVQERVILPELDALHPGSCFIRTLREVTFPLIKTLMGIHSKAIRFERAVRYRDENGFASRDDEIYMSFRRMSELIFAFAVDCEKRFSQEITELVPVLTKATKAKAKALLRRCVHELLSIKEGERTFRGYSARLPSEVREHCLMGLDALRLRKVKSSERKWSRNQISMWRQLTGNNREPSRRLSWIV